MNRSALCVDLELLVKRVRSVGLAETTTQELDDIRAWVQDYIAEAIRCDHALASDRSAAECFATMRPKS